MNYLGLDYHKKYSFATIITEDGEIKEKERLLNRKESFKKYLEEYECRFSHYSDKEYHINPDNLHFTALSIN